MEPKQEIRTVVRTHGIEMLIASVQNLVAERDADLARGFDNVTRDRDGFPAANCLPYRDGFHIRRYQRYHPPEGAFADQACGSGSKPCRRRRLFLKNTPFLKLFHLGLLMEVKKA